MDADLTGPIRDPARLQAVRRTGLLDTPPEDVFDRLTRLAARVVGAPATFMTLVDSDHDFYKSCFGFEEPLASERQLQGTTFCHYAIRTDQPLVIDDTRAHPEYRHVPTVQSLGIAAYLGIPLVTHDGHVIGSFCAVDFQPRRWAETDVEVLRELAASAMREVELRALVDHAERERREKLALLESTDEGIYGLDRDGCCIFINRAGAEMIGWAPEEVLGKEMHPLIHHHREDGTPYPEAECPIARAAKEGAAVRATNEVLWRRDGTCFPVEYSSHPVLEDGERRGAVVTFLDVTERRRAEEARDRAHRELRATLESRSRFFAAMSHELRTPINAILGYNDLLLAGVYGELAPEQRGGIERGQTAARHLLELVNDVLDLSKVEAGKMEIQVEEVSVSALIQDLFATIRPLAAAHGYDLTLDAGPCDTRVRTDPRRVRQILLNLLSNAIKFGERRPVRVRCRTPATGGLAIEVVDQGRGIAPQDQERVFEEFEQVGGARDNVTGQGGTGLGLPISRRLAGLLGGWLEVESEPGQGSTFRLTLPPSPPL
ncbi:MAG TPA: ATP-binding protein [Longimicrobium sp.]|nr:ATP-binding protein [Longimicrobium sp.]